LGDPALPRMVAWTGRVCDWRKVGAAPSVVIRLRSSAAASNAPWNHSSSRSRPSSSCPCPSAPRKALSSVRFSRTTWSSNATRRTPSGAGLSRGIKWPSAWPVSRPLRSLAL